MSVIALQRIILYLREITSGLLVLDLLFSQESGQGDNLSVDTLGSQVVPVGTIAISSASHVAICMLKVGRVDEIHTEDEKTDSRLVK